MPDFRCYIPPSLQVSESVTLSKEESNHLVAANRARKGDPVRVFNGIGDEWDSILETADKRGATLLIKEHHRFTPSPYRIRLGQAIPKGKLLGSIIKKAAELGVQEIVPLETQRTELKLDAKREESKLNRWEGDAIEGSKQSGNPYLVQVAPITPLSQFLESEAASDLKVIGSLRAGAKPFDAQFEQFVSINKRLPQSVTWLIGPEGDLSDDETDSAIAAGFLPTTLGTHVMRCETAAVFSMAITLYELGKRSNL